MNCFRNGVKREGESCSLNNNCIYPNCKLETNFYWWLDHYNSCGDSHYSDTPDWKIREIYFDKIVDRLLEELPEDTDVELLIGKLNKI